MADMARKPHAVMTINADAEPKFRAIEAMPSIRIRYIMEYISMVELAGLSGMGARKP